jgi:hypothetical protein
LVVVVPTGVNTPYIHGDGRIYRRVADASDPKAETDRFILDQLWERRRKGEEALASFLVQKPIVSKGEENSSFIHIFLLQDPMNAAIQNTDLDFERFVALMSEMDLTKEGYNIPFDNFHTMSDGFIGRSVVNNDPYNLVLTWKHFDNGSSLISVPLRKFDTFSVLNIQSLQGYEYENRFIAQLRNRRQVDGTVIDLHTIILMIATFIDKHKELIDEGKISSPTLAKVLLENIWRSIPFLDTDSYMAFIERCGIPLVQQDNVFAPSGKSFDSLVEINYTSNETVSRAAVQLIQAAPLIADVGNAFGLPGRVLLAENGEWIAAIHRSIDVMKRSAGQISDE